MPDNRSAQPLQLPQPNPALKRLEKLIGRWTIKGRTLDAKSDNIAGHVTIQWLPGGFFLEQRGEIDFMGSWIFSLEIVGYDPLTDTFPSYVFSNMGETSASYYWDVRGDVVTHWTKGSKYTGMFSADGAVLSGGWRSEGDEPGSPENSYDAVMVKIK